ncbi:hypothetical protein [Patiriisocius sp. Uisw_017]|jgi:hypothetical protein|uniref:hypothetical protein n=1 Tax=Patiriisocius sp. Uisw_017 TaxID=3230968 RepID=UPI0039ECB654
MKTILITIMAISSGLMAAFAQKNPPPPSSEVSVHSDETKTSSNYSYSESSDGDDGGSSNISVSTSSTDDSYMFRARHDGNKDAKIKALLLKEMGRNNLEVKNGKHTWVTNSGGEEVYEIKFSKGRLRIDLDKTIASAELEKKIVRLGKSARTIISGVSDEKRKVVTLQREAERMQRAADRMRREAVRLQEDQQRNQDRIKLEADRLKRQADRLEDNVRRSGGTSTVIQNLLDDHRTRYDGVNRGTAWVLPGLLPALTNAFIKDKLIDTGNEINVLKETNAMYVNGKQIGSSSMGTYKSIFRTYNVNGNFNFNKSNNHIVFIENAVAIEPIIRALEAEGFISSINKKLKLEINGDSVIRNGEELSVNAVNLINELLLRNNVVAAPGKVLEIRSNNNYQLGYNLDKKTFLGTWVMND